MTKSILTAEAQAAKEALEFAGRDGKIFTVTFIKKDGSVREMNARTGVKAYSQGGVRSTAGNPNIFGLYDMALRKELTKDEARKAYRSLDLNRVTKVNGRNIQMQVK